MGLRAGKGSSPLRGAQGALEHIEHRRGDESHGDRGDRAGNDADANLAEHIGVGVIAVDDAVEIDRAGIEKRDDERGDDQHADELPTRERIAAALGVQTDEQAAHRGRDDPQHGGRGDAVGHQLAEKSADQTDHQTAAGAIEQSADDDGQGGNGNVDPAEADRADGIEHDVDGDHHGDDHQLARGHGAEAVDDDERGDQPDKAGGHAENDGCGRHETIPPQK